MPYDSQIQKRGAVVGRPASYEDLLLEPLTAPGDPAERSYKDWEFDHARSMRFYVGGYRWFMRRTGMYDLSKLSAYGNRAVEKVKAETNWREMPEATSDWESCSINQFRAAKSGTAQHFAKAALVIVACECVLAEKIGNGEIAEGGISIADIYTNMSVIPAAWTITDFNPALLGKLNNIPGTADQVIHAAGQTTRELLTQMAAGHSVTRTTANKIKTHLDGIEGLNCGVVTARASRRGRAAAPGEMIDVS